MAVTNSDRNTLAINIVSALAVLDSIIEKIEQFENLGMDTSALYRSAISLECQINYWRSKVDW